MSVSFKVPPITMKLYETDLMELEKFIVNGKKEAFTEEYLILYNFASDCKYSDYIQPDLIQYLLPFYLRAVEQAVLYNNRIAIDIYSEFNLSLFFNQKNLCNAVGDKNFQHIMEYYIKQTIKKMEMQNPYILHWVSLFNTTAAFCDDNIRQLFHLIFKGSLKIKYSFFQYLSVLLFKESDNLLAPKDARDFWTSTIWDFDDGCFSKNFFWSDTIVEFFNKEVHAERINLLFKELSSYLFNVFGPEFVDLLHEEMNQSFITGVFCNRKAEFLQKINRPSDNYIYWDKTF